MACNRARDCEASWDWERTCWRGRRAVKARTQLRFPKRGAPVRGTLSGIRWVECRQPVRDRMTYENWILNLPTLRPRTYLYHLEPLGVGTPLVESLTSYIGRLAAAHAVSLGILSTKEFGP